ncbi:hypothetical protein RAS1_01800 [Phycisphaerae bacterium RAS1]|nr:hypothetical protein RAS1_01800 [Phycisphaerae bacterium RAS1]
MVVRIAPEPGAASHFGLRMSAGEFLALPESHVRYELVDGVAIVSPSPGFWHQKIVFEICRQIDDHLRQHPVGEVVSDIDVKLRDDLVYRPDVVFLSAAKAARVDERITEPPDLVVEVISADSRSFDTQTKRADYEAAGVAECWLIDPERQSMRFLVLEGGRYREATVAGDKYASVALPGFELDLGRDRRLFAAFQSPVSSEGDALTSELLESNERFRKLVARSKARARTPFGA